MFNVMFNKPNIAFTSELLMAGDDINLNSDDDDDVAITCSAVCRNVIASALHAIV